MHRTLQEVYAECLKQFTGADGRESLGGAPLKTAAKGSLAEKTASILTAMMEGKPFPSGIPEQSAIKTFFNLVKDDFIKLYSKTEYADFIEKRAEIIFKSDNPVERAKAVSELWLPDLTIDDDRIFSAWKLSEAVPNQSPYRPEEVLIQLNALYTPCGDTAPGWISPELTAEYQSYFESAPEKIAVYDHPVPVFSRGKSHELENCLIELNSDIGYEKQCGVFPEHLRLPVLISISTTHAGLDRICEKWLGTTLNDFNLDNLDCFLLSENKAESLRDIIGSAAGIFTVQGEYACHFGALKYAQLIFEKAYGIRAGFKLDTDEGIHSQDLKEATGRTWLEHLCHPFWGGSAVTSDNRRVMLGFNIGEYVDSRDMDNLGYATAIRTPEVKLKEDLRGSFLLFNKGAAQAKGTALLNRTEKLEDFISHPLVKGGGYGVDNFTLKAAVPVGFSMVGRAEDQQFYFSALRSRFQGIFNPFLRIIHYKDSVAGAEHKNEAVRNVADIYRMLIFREMMKNLDVIDLTRPFPSVYASELAPLQAFILWIYFIFKSSLEGDEATAEVYLNEGKSRLIPLLSEISCGKVMKQFKKERSDWKFFINSVMDLSVEAARSWTESLKL